MKANGWLPAVQSECGEWTGSWWCWFVLELFGTYEISHELHCQCINQNF